MVCNKHCVFQLEPVQKKVKSLTQLSLDPSKGHIAFYIYLSEQPCQEYRPDHPPHTASPAPEHHSCVSSYAMIYPSHVMCYLDRLSQLSNIAICISRLSHNLWKHQISQDIYLPTKHQSVGSEASVPVHRCSEGTRYLLQMQVPLIL